MAAAQAVKRGREGWVGGKELEVGGVELRATNAKVILHTSPRHENCKPTPKCSPWPRHLILFSFWESVKTWWMAEHTVMLSWAINISTKPEDLVRHRPNTSFHNVGEVFAKSESQIDCHNYEHDREEVVNLMVWRQTAVYRALHNQW